MILFRQEDKRATILQGSRKRVLRYDVLVTIHVLLQEVLTCLPYIDR